MASSSASLFKTLIPNDLFLTSSLPTTTLSPKIPLLSLSSKPSFAISLSIKKKLTFQQTVVPFVAQTSDWAQQEEESQEVSEEEGEGEDIVAEGIGETEEVVEDYEEPPEDAKLFVGNLPFDVDSESLAHLFDKAGTVDIAEVIYNRETGQSRGFGFVTMNTVEEAEKAVEMFSRYDINGRLLTVNKAAPRGTRPERAAREFEPSFRIYVGNLPWSVDDSRLEQVFSEHGKVVSARVVYDRDSGRSRGFGFVTMASETELNDAIAALDGQVRRTFFTLQSEPWTVPWTTQTIIQVMLLWICSFWIVGSWIIPFLAHIFNFSKHSLTYRGQALYSLVTDIAAGLAGVTILHRCLSKFRPLPTGWFHFSLEGTWYFDVLFACLLFPLVNILTQINMNMVHALPSPTIAVSSVEQSILARDPIAMVLYALVVLVCAPIWEEILFRGFILPSLTRYMPLWSSILLSALAFAFTHFNVQRLLPLVLLGVMKGVVFARSKNLLAPMFLHSLWNGYVFLDLMK